jgi:predicted alpha-1,2-mannosidase
MNGKPLHVLLFLFVLISCTVRKDIPESLRPVDLVYPHIDAANSRWFFFSSASRPFGMVNLSPDMLVEGTWGTGYRYHVDTIRCFSHIHAWQMSGIPVMPTTGEFKGHLGPDAYGSRYSRNNEKVRPGYHQVLLDNYGINVELTSTTRVGFHRYTFPTSGQSQILFDFTTTLGPSDTQSGYVRKNSNREIEGYAIMAPTVRRPKPVMVFFVAQFDKAFESFGGWEDGKIVEVADVIEGPATGAFVGFKTNQNEVRKMKVAISYVSMEQARLNLDTELPHWDFDRIVVESANDWNQWLSRIEVEGGTEKERRRFYTDLWKALQGRRIISDANGKYCDMTGDERRIGQIPLDENGRPKFNHHNSDSFWGAQWSLNTLWHLVYPEVTESFVNSMLLMYDDGGLIPRGPSGGNYTFVMTGASSTPFIVSAYMKGIRGFDVEKAYEGMRKNHMPGGLMSKAGYEHQTFIGGGIEHYIEKGYIPHPLSNRRYGFHQDGSGQTLEYSYQDWTLAQMAKTLGNESDYEMFSQRALNYKNIWHADSGWMWVRDHQGNWKEPFDILQYGNGWVEGNAAQYTWWVPHDVQGLIGLMGGREAFTEKLNGSFELAETHDFVSGKSHSVETLKHNREVYINYGNQPCMQTAFLFNHSGAPWLTQYWTRQVINKVYSDLSPDYGYSGDEDQGLMGSLAVLLKMGIFSTNGGTNINPYYEIASPIFDKITIHFNPKYYSGNTFVIQTENNGPENYYIQSAEFNGQELRQSWVPHKEVVDGSVLKLVMGPAPNKSWGGINGNDIARTD